MTVVVFQGSNGGGLAAVPIVLVVVGRVVQWQWRRWCVGGGVLSGGGGAGSVGSAGVARRGCSGVMCGVGGVGGIGSCVHNIICCC